MSLSSSPSSGGRFVELDSNASRRPSPDSEGHSEAALPSPPAGAGERQAQARVEQVKLVVRAEHGAGPVVRRLVGAVLILPLAVACSCDDYRGQVGGPLVCPSGSRSRIEQAHIKHSSPPSQLHLELVAVDCDTSHFAASR